MRRTQWAADEPGRPRTDSSHAATILCGAGWQPAAGFQPARRAKLACSRDDPARNGAKHPARFAYGYGALRSSAAQTCFHSSAPTLSVCGDPVMGSSRISRREPRWLAIRTPIPGMAAPGRNNTRRPSSSSDPSADGGRTASIVIPLGMRSSRANPGFAGVGREAVFPCRYHHHHGLLAAFRAVDGGIEEAGDGIRGGPQAHALDTRGHRWQHYRGDQGDDAHHHQHLDQRDAAGATGLSNCRCPH